MIDTLEAEQFGPLGQPLCLLAADAGERAAALAGGTQAILLGVDPVGALPSVDPAPFDALLTTAALPPRPWVHVPPARWEARIAAIGARVAVAPFAATIAMQVLRLTEAMTFNRALQVESLAYSTLLGGAEFRRWRAAHPAVPVSIVDGPFVDMAREKDELTITLVRPAGRNAMCAGMRDALFAALAAALDDPSRPTMLLRGAGACFSTGGDLTEFGTAQDLAAAHAVRTARACAVLLHRLGHRATALLHGACVGSGIEIPAAAARRIGHPQAFFHLPELAMGLMPGAGGTVTLPRAIGRHRTAYMLLSGRRINAATALGWGLLTGMAEA